MCVNVCRKKILLRCDIRIKLNNFGGLDISFSTGNGCDSWGGPKHRGQVVVGNTEKGKFKPAESKINFAVPRRAVVSSELSPLSHEDVNKGNNKITELRTILQRESQNS